MRGDEEGIQVALKAGHHRPARETPFKMAFHLRVYDGPTLNVGLVAFVIFRGSGQVLL